MSFIQFYLYNDLDGVAQLSVLDDVNPNVKRYIRSPDYPDYDTFPLPAGGTTAALQATALSDGGPQANVEWTANPGHQQSMTTVENGKIYDVSSGYERG